jgi:nucleoside-diphosphate-sugar epimerase
MIVAITGGTGFIGRHLIARHLQRGDEVRYLTRDDKTPISGATPVIGDLNNKDILMTLVKNSDVLYHCAAELVHADKMYETNVLGTKTLLNAAKGQVKRFVQLSSTGIYGAKPFQDVFEETPVNPSNDYEKSKTQADNLVLDAMTKNEIYGVILRPSNVYALDMPNQSLFQLIKMVKRGWFFFVGSKRAIVNYIHVEDVISALVLCSTANLPGNGRIYIVSDWCYLDEMIAVFARALNVPCPTLRLPEGLVRFLAKIGDALPRFPLRSSRVEALTYEHRYSIDRISTELGFKLTIPIESGLCELCENLK